MKLLFPRFLLVACCFFLFNNLSVAQCGVPTYQFGTTTPFNQSVINLSCGQNCTDIKFQTPHIKSTSDYSITSIGYNPFPFVTPTGTEDPSIYNDDRYSAVYPLPFQFCFYDSLFSNVVIGSNGIITFELGNAGCSNAAWNITSPLPHNSGLNTPPCTTNSSSYPRAAIMGVFQDLDPRPGPNDATNSSPSDRKIEWRIEGTAPCRKFVVSYYHIGVYASQACGTNPNTAATFQMVLYENTGMIDIYILNKQCTPTSEVNAILGIHDWNRTRWQAAPGKNATQWTSSNEGYRFTPSAGPSRFVQSELLSLSGTHIAYGDTSTTVDGTLDINYPNICPTGQSTQYIVRTFFSSCSDPASLLFSQDTVTINRTLNLNATATMTPTGCGAPTGTITVNVPAGLGAGPFTYTLDGGTPVTDPSRTHTFNNVAAGPHTIYVTDATGCNSTINITVTLNGTLAVNATPTATGCPGINNGSITVNVTAGSGVAPYQYSLNGGPFQLGNIFTNLAANSYSITVTDAGGCSGTVIVTVATGPGPTATTTNTPTSCTGVNNGTITVTPTSGVPPYQYSIDGLAFQASNIFTNLTPGTHFIIFQDGGGCQSATITVTIAAGSNITGTTTNTPTSCPGVNNGTITVTATSGTPTYTYSLDGGTYQASNVFTNVAAGAHAVVIKDALGCLSNSLAVNILAGTGPTGTASSTATSCPGVNNGTITVSPSSGSAPYQYSLDGGSYQASNIFTNVSAGGHTIVFKDAVGCQSANIPVSVLAGTGPTGNATSTATSCPGVNNGTVTVTPTTGIAPYTYSIDGAAYQASNIFTNVSAGPHTIVFQDAVGCTSANIAVTVTAGSGPLGTASSTAASCTGVNNGTITVTPGTGTSPYQYSLDGGAYQPSNIFTNVAPGPHTIVFQDATSCTSANIAVTVATGAGSSGTATSTAASCTGVNNGTITATATAGSSPYQYSLDGGTYQVGNIFTNVAAGSHNVTIKDAVGCVSALIPVTVTTGAGSTGTATSTAASCTGVSNGTITATATAGISPYQYSLDGGTYQVGNVFTNVAAGSHNVTIKDAVGCISALIPVTVTTGAGSTGTATSTAASCTGVSNGTITATATAGISPYQYSLDGGAYQVGNVFTNIAAGSHNVTIKDAVGCISPLIPVTVATGAGSSGTATSTATACAGVNNGTITATATAGISPYQYALDGGTYQAGNIFTNVSAGPHNVTIKDAVGCISPAIAVTVSTGAGATGTATSTATACTGVSNGTITVTATAGTSPYQYALDGGAYQAGNIFTNIAAGPHNVTIQDAVGCTSANIPVTVTTGAGANGTATSTAASCTGIGNGTVTVTATTGTSPYQYAIDGGTYQVSNVFSNLAAGSHNATVKDALGCISPAIAVTVATGPGVTGTASSTQTSCSGVNNGSITVTITTGNSPYQYVLDGGTPQAINIFNNVAAGSHNVVVTDAVGCVSSPINVTVVQGSGVTGSATSTATACNGASNGTVTVTPTNGQSPYQYAIDGGAFQPGNTFTNLASGPHTAIFRDAAGCTSPPINVTVTQGAALTAAITQTNINCNGNTNGVINASVNAPGAAPFQYSLNNITFQASGTFNALAAGNYTVYFKDNQGCSGQQTVTLTQPALLGLTVNAQPVLCNGQNNGTITVTGSGGTTPYQFSLDNITYQASGTFNVIAGTYTVYVKDNNGCVKSQANITVTQPAAVTLTASSTAAGCPGNDGTITATAGGGVGAFQYSIDGVNFQPSNTFTGVSPGPYTVTVKDGNNCSKTFNVTVALTNTLTFSKGADPTICEGSPAQLTVTSNATQYNWTPATGLSSTTIANPVATPAVTTTYTVKATLGVCSTTGNITVNVNPAPIADAGPLQDICFGQDAQLSGSGGVQYQWAPPIYLSDPTIASPQVIKPAQTTTYRLTVTDANGCKSLVPGTVLVNVVPPIKVFVSPKDTIVAEGDSIRLLATSIGTGYTWTNGSTLSNPNIPNPVAFMPAGSLGNVYTYKVTASTSAGCTGEATITLRVYKGPEIYMVSAFTPNGDGKNEKFVPIPVGVKKLNFYRVFDRGGRMLFSTTTLNEGWDGTYREIPQPPAVYVWIVEGVGSDNKVIFKKGTVTLIR